MLRCVICGHELEEKPNGAEVTNWAPGRPLVLVRLCEQCWKRVKKLQGKDGADEVSG